MKCPHTGIFEERMGIRRIPEDGMTGVALYKMCMRVYELNIDLYLLVEIMRYYVAIETIKDLM